MALWVKAPPIMLMVAPVVQMVPQVLLNILHQERRAVPAAVESVQTITMLPAEMELQTTEAEAAVVHMQVPALAAQVS